MKTQHDFMDSTGKPRIVIEQATFRRNIDFDKPETCYYKVGLNHFTYDKGIFHNQNSPADRWEKIKEEQKIDIKPWRQDEYNDNKHILFLLQNPIDTSLNPLYERGEQYDSWINKTIKEIKSITNKKVKVRLHPRFQGRFDLQKLSLIADEIRSLFSNVDEQSFKNSIHRFYGGR